MSRCVRRAFLCGDALLSGRNFDHRKQWVEDRLLFFSKVFSASALAYAVMSNHLHVVVHMAPEQVDRWTNEEVAERWVRLCPVMVNGEVEPGLCRRKVAALLANEARFAELRHRLGSLSWFMRCLAETIARAANREDECTGRSWEGRFKCQVLLDDAAVLACMAYVDLNPVRAGVAADLHTSHHTSIKRKLNRSVKEKRPISAIAGPPTLDILAITEADCIDLVHWAGRQLRPDKRGRIHEAAPKALRRLGDEDRWLEQVGGIERRYWRAVGAAENLIERAKEIGQS